MKSRISARRDIRQNGKPKTCLNQGNGTLIMITHVDVGRGAASCQLVLDTYDSLRILARIAEDCIAFLQIFGRDNAF